MSTCTLCLTHPRFQAQAHPVKQPLGFSHQLRLPLDPFYPFRVIRQRVERAVRRHRGWIGLPSGADRIVVFGKGKYVCVGTSIRRVEIG